MGIGAYAALFPLWFELVHGTAARAGDGFAVDLVATGLLLLPPTFLMGATVPLLTAAVPESSAEVPNCHARIYGLNTLGAFAGVLLGAFSIIPELGLNGALFIGGALDLLAGLILALNGVKGTVLRSDPIPLVPNRFGNVTLFGFAFVSGAVIISTEMIVMRALALAMGSGFYVFPIGVGLFVLGLAAGSLKSASNQPTVRAFFNSLVASIAGLVLIYLTIPLWPSWVSHVRISLATIPSNFPVYLVLGSVVVGLAVFPFLLSAGRLLPLTYALLEKDSRDFGKACGRLYFFNTAGTVAGAVLIGHLAMHWISLDSALRASITMLTASLAWLALQASPKGKLTSVLVGVAALCALVLPDWNRSSHYEGLFRTREPASFHFNGLFSIPPLGSGAGFFRDDPDSTVAVVHNLKNPGKALMNNGKPDGNTYSADYPTMVLTGSLGYLHAPERHDLRAAVVGLGTGITTGILGKGTDISSVDVIEISSAVIEASKEFQDENFGTLSNPKITHVRSDAFRYFARLEQAGHRFDVIASEPSNPWVVGVENLFTPTFYELAKSVLSHDGVFVQWVQIYEMEPAIFQSILSNVSASFEHAKVYLANRGDLMILASRKPLMSSAVERRLAEPVMGKVHGTIGVEGKDSLLLLELYGEEEVRWLARTYQGPRHDVHTPRIGFDAAKSLFMGAMMPYERLIGSDIARKVRYRPEKEAALEKLLAKRPAACDAKPLPIASAVCSRISQYGQARAIVRDLPESVPLPEIVASYAKLRESGLSDARPGFLKKVSEIHLAETVAANGEDKKFATEILIELTRDERAAEAHGVLDRFAAKGLFRSETIVKLRAAIENSRKSIDSAMARYQQVITRQLETASR